MDIKEIMVAIFMFVTVYGFSGLIAGGLERLIERELKTNSSFGDWWIKHPKMVHVICTLLSMIVFIIYIEVLFEGF